MNMGYNNLYQKDCAHYLGTNIAERTYGRKILPEMFGEILKEMPYGNPFYDFIVMEDILIDIKSCSMRNINGWKGWDFHIRFNNTADYFVLLAFGDRIEFNLIHIWPIGRDEIVRGNK